MLSASSIDITAALHLVNVTVAVDLQSNSHNKQSESYAKKEFVSRNKEVTRGWCLTSIVGLAKQVSNFWS